MLKHLALVEDQWFTVIFRGQADHSPPFADVDWARQRLGLAQCRRRFAGVPP